MSEELPLDVQAYKANLERGLLLVLACRDCGKEQLGMQAFCLFCSSPRLERKPIKALGRVLMSSEVRVHPEGNAQGPYIWALIRLENDIKIPVKIKGERARQGDLVDIAKGLLKEV